MTCRSVFGIAIIVGCAGFSAAQETRLDVPIQSKDVDGRLERAFGKECAELRRPVRLWIASRRIVLAAAEFDSLGDNRVRLKQVSIARFDLDESVAATMHGQSAILTIDRANAAISDLATCQISSLAVNITADFTAPFPLESDREQQLFLPSQETGVKPRIVVTPDKVDERKAIHIGADFLMQRLHQRRFSFKIDELAKIDSLLPSPPTIVSARPNWQNEDLARVPEVMIGEPISKRIEHDKALEATAYMLAKINYLNAKKTDGFLLALLDRREDLRGLPMRMGNECRTEPEQAKTFRLVADTINRVLGSLRTNGNNLTPAAVILTLDQTWTSNLKPMQAKEDTIQRATVAAITQILMPESETFRLALAKFLATIPHVDATHALARLALFSAEDAVRAAALDGLKTRRERDYTMLLLDGFRHPLPAVSKRAAEALVKLERKDVLRDLVDVLETPDPRLPVTHKRDGKEVTTVRELVRVNHHRNCALCHAPGNTGTVPEGVLTVAVPLPGEPLPQPQQGGYQSTPPASPDIVVRVDMTYLRQDFSLLMPVANAQPWPEMQRFDFLVRTRELTKSEAEGYVPSMEPGSLPPHHRAALFALRELTGRDTGPSADAWRSLLKLTRS